MCFLMDPNLGKNVCYVQFPQRFDGIDRNDRYANRNTVFFDVSSPSLQSSQKLYFCVKQLQVLHSGFAQPDLYVYTFPSGFQINLRGLDGIQGPVYVGTGCVFNRTALYGYEPPVKPKHKKAGFVSSLCGGSRKKGSKSSKKGSDKKKSNKHVDPTVPIFSLEDIEEGVEGNL